MATMISRSAPAESVRPVTSAFVEALDVVLDELAAQNGNRDGAWVDDLQTKIDAAVERIEHHPWDANAAQVAQSAIRDRISQMRLLLNSVAITSLLAEPPQQQPTASI